MNGIQLCRQCRQRPALADGICTPCWRANEREQQLAEARRLQQVADAWDAHAKQSRSSGCFHLAVALLWFILAIVGLGLILSTF